MLQKIHYADITAFDILLYMVSISSFIFIHIAFYT